MEAAESTIAEQNEQLKEKLRSACDIEKIGYYLNPAEEKRIGKAHLKKMIQTLKIAMRQNEVNLTNDHSYFFLYHRKDLGMLTC